MASPGIQLDPITIREAELRVNPQVGFDLLNLAERAVAAACLVLSGPVLLPVLAAVRTLSGRSPLVAHERVGLNGETFWMLKVRTMWNRTAHHGSPSFIERVRTIEIPVAKAASDPRVTSRLAAFCRRHSIDELPQLVHVITGRMSLVGPRPLTPVELETFYGKDAAEVTSIRPGLTGLWQVSGRSRLTYAQRKRFDLFLVRHRSFALYCKLIYRTPPKILNGRDAF